MEHNRFHPSPSLFPQKITKTFIFSPQVILISYDAALVIDH
jgi:hypothetical protein